MNLEANLHIPQTLFMNITKPIEFAYWLADDLEFSAGDDDSAASDDGTPSSHYTYTDEEEEDVPYSNGIPASSASNASASETDIKRAEQFMAARTAILNEGGCKSGKPC